MPKTRHLASKKLAVRPLDALIHVVRGQKIMLDDDLAQLYNVPTKRLNEAVKRNPDRFPERFMFQLTLKELKRCEVANCDLKHPGAAAAVICLTPSPNTAS
jgi:hypothetical protein